MANKASVLAKLNEMGISYREEIHHAVYTIEDMANIHLNEGEVIAKNLFMRDARGKNHFLLSLTGDKQVNLKDIRKKIGSSQLSFASEERLFKYLGLEKGAVTPFGVINDSSNHVKIYIDKTLKEASAIGFHPNDNTATIFLSLEDVISFVKAQGNMVSVLAL